eukprot:m51a1_g9687 hypothetical protein (275) ;mRNA; f:1329088-1330097
MSCPLSELLAQAIPELAERTALRADDLCRLGRVCRALRAAVASEALWQRLYLRDIGAPAETPRPGDAWRDLYRRDFCSVWLFPDGSGGLGFRERRRMGAIRRDVRVIVRPSLGLAVEKSVPIPREPMTLQGFSYARDVVERRGVRMALFALTSPPLCSLSLDCVVPDTVTSHEVIMACLPEREVRWGVLAVDRVYADRNGLAGDRRYGRHVPVVFLWAPDTSTARAKMAAACVCEPLSLTLAAPGAMRMQATCYEEFRIEDVMFHSLPFEERDP